MRWYAYCTLEAGDRHVIHVSGQAVTAWQRSAVLAAVSTLLVRNVLHREAFQTRRPSSGCLEVCFTAYVWGLYYLMA